MQKNEARKLVMQRRKLHSEEQFFQKSKVITEQMLHILDQEKAEEIFAYCSYGGEVDTWGLIRECLKRKLRVAVPKSFAENCEMQFYYIESEEDLAEGYKGIYEPKEHCMAAGQDGSHSSSILIMPGVAFDLQKNRAGYGKGFYDRYLSRHSFAKVLAPAFEFQIFEHISCDIHDQCPDLIVTEERILS